MKDKVLKVIGWFNDKLPNLQGNKYIKLITYSLITVIFICFILFIFGWFFNLTQTKTADLRIILELLTILCSSGFAGLFLLIIKLGVDKNNDGYPDILEKEDVDDRKRNH